MFAFDPMPIVEFRRFPEKGPQLSWIFKKILCDLLRASGGHLKAGPAPPGELERLLQSQLRACQARPAS